jgi:hypothetical protein
MESLEIIKSICNEIVEESIAEAFQEVVDRFDMPWGDISPWQEARRDVIETNFKKLLEEFVLQNINEMPKE